VYAEPLSGLREELADIAIHNERTLHRGTFDHVIRIGNVPTFRFWRDLESRDVPVTHYSRLPFTGLTRREMRPLDSLTEIAGRRDEALYAFDREQSSRFAQILDDEPQSELALIRSLSKELPANARIYLGNSLPIREWDLAATRERHRRPAVDVFRMVRAGRAERRDRGRPHRDVRPERAVDRAAARGIVPHRHHQ